MRSSTDVSLPPPKTPMTASSRMSSPRPAAPMPRSIWFLVISQPVCWTGTSLVRSTFGFSPAGAETVTNAVSV